MLECILMLNQRESSHFNSEGLKSVVLGADICTYMLHLYICTLKYIIYPPITLHQSYPCMISQVKQLYAWFPCLPLWQTCNVFTPACLPSPITEGRPGWTPPPFYPPCPCWLRFLLLLPVTLLRIPNALRSQGTEPWQREMCQRVMRTGEQKAPNRRGNMSFTFPFHTLI